MQHAAGIGEMPQRHRRPVPVEMRAGVEEALELARGRRRRRVVGAGQVRIDAADRAVRRRQRGGDERPGIALYGVLPDPASRAPVALRPVLSLHSQVVYFKVVAAGHPVSYGGTWSSPVDTRVVTIPIGYGDGWPRALSSRGEVIVRGMRRPIVGRICMDQFMVDLGPDGTAYNEDDVVLIGTQGGETIRCEDVAASAGTIPYEILVNLNTRIPREYVGGAAPRTG